MNQQQQLLLVERECSQLALCSSSNCFVSPKYTYTHRHVRRRCDEWIPFCDVSECDAHFGSKNRILLSFFPFCLFSTEFALRFTFFDSRSVFSSHILSNWMERQRYLTSDCLSSLLRHQNIHFCPIDPSASDSICMIAESEWNPFFSSLSSVSERDLSPLLFPISHPSSQSLFHSPPSDNNKRTTNVREKEEVMERRGDRTVASFHSYSLASISSHDFHSVLGSSLSRPSALGSWSERSLRTQRQQRKDPSSSVSFVPFPRIQWGSLFVSFRSSHHAIPFSFLSDPRS